MGEIRWGRSTGPNRYLHGVKIKNLSPEQRDELFELLKRTAGAVERPAASAG